MPQLPGYSLILRPIPNIENQGGASMWIRLAWKQV